MTNHFGVTVIDFGVSPRSRRRLAAGLKTVSDRVREGKNAGKQMSENEGDSSIPFIDDAEEQKLADELAQRQYNLKITRNYQNKTRRVEISKILQDAEPMTHRSLSPVAPLANDAERLTDEEDGETVTGAEFELTIKSNNSIIRIQGYDNKSTISFNSSKRGNVYDLISKEVDKIFRKPEREEIERAMKNIKNGEKRTKEKKNWKALTKSLITAGKLVSEHRRGSVERYPKMVLLQEEEPQTEECLYPKMVILNDQDRSKTDTKKRKKFPNRDVKKIKESAEDKEDTPSEDTENDSGEVKDIKEESKKNKVCEERKGQCSCENCTRFGRHPLREMPSFENEDMFYPAPPPCCQYPSLYVPVYNRQLPYHPYNSGDFCCGGRILKDTTTQTNPSDVEPLVPEEQKELNDFPIDFLSSFFPRIVVMKSFQEEVPAEDNKIFELPKTETETEDEKRCEELDEKDQQEPRIEEEEKEDSEENGFSEDSGKEDNATSDDFPLTKIGHSIYDKLNELANERRKEEEKVEEAGEAEEGEEATGTKTSPRNVTLQFRNKLMRFTLAEDKVNLEVQESGVGEGGERNSVSDDKVVVRKSKLWYPSTGEKTRKDLTLGKDCDEVSFSVSERENLVFTFEMGRDSPRKRTCEAKVGTDGLDIAGGDFAVEGTDKRDLSPRTDEILKSLKSKLEATEGPKKRSRANDDFKFPGLFLIRPFDLNRGFPRDEYSMSKEREARKRKELPGKLREYYCEDCLATMRLFEDGKVSVKSMIDKFETIIHLGSY